MRKIAWCIAFAGLSCFLLALWQTVEIDDAGALVERVLRSPTDEAAALAVINDSRIDREVRGACESMRVLQARGAQDEAARALNDAIGAATRLRVQAIGQAVLLWIATIVLAVMTALVARRPVRRLAPGAVRSNATFGERLRATRLSLGLTQKALGAATRTDQARISRIEQGQFTPTPVVTEWLEANENGAPERSGRPLWHWLTTRR